jgi:hypothetical protein
MDFLAADCSSVALSAIDGAIQARAAADTQLAASRGANVPCRITMTPRRSWAFGSEPTGCGAGGDGPPDTEHSGTRAPALTPGKPAVRGPVIRRVARPGSPGNDTNAMTQEKHVNTPHRDAVSSDDEMALVKTSRRARPATQASRAADLPSVLNEDYAIRIARDRHRDRHRLLPSRHYPDPSRGASLRPPTGPPPARR